MSLYRHDATGFLCEYATSPGAGYTAVTAFPGDTAGRISWWRSRCVDAALGQSSAWHPSLSSSTELSLPYGLAGRGVNIVPSRYSVFNETAGLPDFYKVSSTSSTTSAYGGTMQAVACQSSVANGTVWFCNDASDYNISLTAYRRWIVQAQAAAHTAGARTAKLVLKTNASGTEYEIPFTTGATAGAYAKAFGAIDLSADGSNRAMLGIRMPTTGTGGAVRIDQAMLEELIGDTITPSPWVVGGGSTVQEGQILSLPGDVVGGFQVIAGSIHSIQATNQSSQTIPTGSSGFTSSNINLIANNYRTAVILFFDVSANVLYQTQIGMDFNMKRSGSTVDYTSEITPFFYNTTGNYFRRYSGVLIDPAPGAGAITYNLNITQSNSSSMTGTIVKCVAFELSQ